MRETCGPRRENYNFWLEKDTTPAVDRVAHMHQQIIDVVRSGVAAVDNESGVLFRDLRPADGVTLQACFIDQRGGVMAFRAAESAACGRKIQRLLGTALIAKLLHTGRNSLGIVLLKTNHGTENNTAGRFLKITPAVAESAVGVEQLIQALIGYEEKNDALYYILELSAVGTGIHDASATQRTGDASGKLQAFQPVFLCKGSQTCERHACLGIDGAVRQQEELLKLLSADDEEIIQTLVGEKNIGAVAQDERGERLVTSEGTASARTGPPMRKEE